MIDQSRMSPSQKAQFQRDQQAYDKAHNPAKDRDDVDSPRRPTPRRPSRSVEAREWGGCEGYSEPRGI